MYVSRAVIVALIAAGTASALADKAGNVVPPTASSSLDNLRGSRGLQHVYDNGRSNDGNDGINADNIDMRPGVNPDSGDEDYRVQDWVEDPSDGIMADSIVEGYNYTDYEWTYDGPLLSEPGNGLPPGSLNVCEGDCDDDLDCAPGLVCWYEDGSGRVPGCSGFPKEFWEYCIDPSVLPKRDVTHSNTLMDYGDATGPASLGHCQGDCDYDIDCEGNNVCFYADGTGIVPGCDGTPTPSWEYCADPETIKEHRAKIGLENLVSTDGYCPASIPYEGRVEMGKVNTTLANEVSGMVNGRRNPNVLYVHNDRNNAPRLMAIDKNNGRIVQNWNIGGINHTDYEDISNGPGPKAGVNYLHLCDIGDNPWDRQTIWIHRLPEPALTGPIGPKTFYPQTLTLRYPDGPKNAEACMVDPLTGLIYIIHKTRRTAQIYKTEKPWGDGDEIMDLVMAGTVTNLRKPARWGNALTGIDISPNGRDIAMLYYGGLDYRCRNENESIEDALGRFGLLVPSYIEEPNGGEAIAFASDMSGLYSCQEGGYDPEVPLYRYPATVAGMLTGRASNATPEPSVKPTNAPTDAPTAAPTVTPTLGPTSAPTVSPTTASPTPSPSTEAQTKEAAKRAEKLAKEAEKAEAERLKNEKKAAEDLAKAKEEKNKADEIALRTEVNEQEATKLEKGQTASPTEAPLTASPTAGPTKTPTASPVTSSPTASPSASPVTSSPTASPTMNPTTVSPTPGPSASPTARPTPMPSKLPTPGPSASPTVRPTRSPSKLPTPGPSVSPTSSPTVSPTSSPTKNPTNSPTPAPSSSPTPAPTKQPTNAPTTASPTTSPSASPSAAPTTEAQGKAAAKLAEKLAKEAEKAEAERIKDEKKAAELRAKEAKKEDDIALRTKEGEEKAAKAADGEWNEMIKCEEKWTEEAKKNGSKKKGSGSKLKSAGSKSNNTPGNRNNSAVSRPGNRLSDESKQGSKSKRSHSRSGRSSF